MEENDKDYSSNYEENYSEINDVNKSIGCTVTNCKNHCKNKNYCSLTKIEIEAHKANPNACENIDCKSFEKDI